MVSFSTDSYFHIGEAHLGAGKPCQDYATSGVHNNTAYAIVSDGCSTGGNTDVGSRITALSAATAIKNYTDILSMINPLQLTTEVGFEQRFISKSVRTDLGLKIKDMFSTCVYAVVNEYGGTFFIQGDGVIALKKRDGSIMVRNFEWEGNMPFYPAYSEQDIENFVNFHGGNLTNKRLKSTIEYISSGRDGNADTRLYSVAEGIKGLTVEIPGAFLEEIEFIAVFSDGVTQIAGIKLTEAIKEFMSFKNIKGEFAKRRMIRGIKDSYNLGSGPFDDISYAVIYVEHDKQES